MIGYMYIYIYIIQGPACLMPWYPKHSPLRVWPISKGGLSPAMKNLLFFFANKFFLFACLEKVARQPTQ